MTGETLHRTMADYVTDFDRGAISTSFFDKWGLLIKLTTGLHILEIQGMEAMAAACVTAQRCRELSPRTP
jgi:hypothetical protein